MKTTPLVALFVAFACGGNRTPASDPAQPDPAPVRAPTALKPANDELAALIKLEGNWRGTGEGEPGSSTVERSYRWVLGGRYLEVRNQSAYKPQPKNPKGELHEDVGLVSYDKGRKKLVFRQFHVEGFVTQYVLESSTPDTFVFVSEAIENIPPGFRARETLRFLGDEQLEKTFEITPPSKEFALYSKTTLASADR